MTRGKRDGVYYHIEGKQKVFRHIESGRYISPQRYSEPLIGSDTVDDETLADQPETFIQRVDRDPHATVEYLSIALQRYYHNVVVYSYENKTDQQQLFLVHDYIEADCDLIVDLKTLNYVLVLICSFANLNQRVVSVCGFCNSSLLNYFVNNACATMEIDPLEPSYFLPCKHAVAVLSHIIYRNGYHFDTYDGNFLITLESNLLNEMMNPNFIVEPSKFILKDFIYKNKLIHNGILLVFIGSHPDQTGFPLTALIAKYLAIVDTCWK